ncbi:ankyrin repeat domain-containing protein SOWAHD [Excalfactoria chinensis]|uniref:ankyrin repeat domain-containing protein SOWAHD n=1 Tax=Excalfactoria chinensis TaxID=46218 RepID=UPI003B3A85CB
MSISGGTAMAQLEQAESLVEQQAAGDAQRPVCPEVSQARRSVSRLCSSPSSTQRKELREILLQSSSLSHTMQMTSSGPGLFTGPQEQEMLEQRPKVLSFTLHREWLLAMARGDTANILRLLDQDPSLLSAADPVTGFSALHWLAKHGHQKSFSEVISLAQKKGCPINVNIRTTMGGFTPLCLAAQQGHASLIEVLVKEYKADTSLRDHSGRKAWQYLREDTSRELKELAGALEENSAQPGTHNTNSEEKDHKDVAASRRAPRLWRQLSVPKFIRRAFAFFRRH